MSVAESREKYLIWAEPKDPREDGWTTAEPSSETADGMRIDRNVPVQVAEGVNIRVDVFRPEAATEPLPVLLCWGPYGKHHTKDIPGDGIEPGWTSKYTAFEAADPLYWTRQGYALVVADARGSWGSDGDLYAHEVREIDDVVQTIEWCGTQEWSSGRVGMSGVSYLAETQWLAAARRPAHLVAINPWEGFTNAYSDHSFHDGIPEVSFTKFFAEGLTGLHRVEDPFAEAQEHPLLDDYWQGRIPDLENIVVPAFVVASWSDHGLHSRGTLRGFERISSEQKWLDVHGGKKWRYYYRPDAVDRARQFFDTFLKEDAANEVSDWPKARLQILDTEGPVIIERDAWPPRDRLERSVYLRADGTFGDVSAEPATFSYPAKDGSVVFDWAVDEELVILGGMQLRLWLSVEGWDDADLFVRVEKILSTGETKTYNYFSVREDGPLALGWLRASHRVETDEVWSTDLPHDRELKIPAGAVVPVTVDIWPTGDLVRPGETLRITIQGHDFMPVVNGMGQRHDVFTDGVVSIHTGAGRDSSLFIPYLPSSALAE